MERDGSKEGGGFDKEVCKLLEGCDVDVVDDQGQDEKRREERRRAEGQSKLDGGKGEGGDRGGAKVGVVDCQL